MNVKFTDRKFKTFQIVIVVLCLIVSTQVNTVEAAEHDVEIDGILVNKTITWFGQDFFSHFAQAWRNQHFRGEGVAIEEKPSARQGTLIIIRYKGAIVYRVSIAGTRSNSRKRGARAVSYVLSRIQSIDIASAGFGQIDLSGDEF